MHSSLCVSSNTSHSFISVTSRQLNKCLCVLYLSLDSTSKSTKWAMSWVKSPLETV